jgi:hypothetical protein
MQSTISAAAFGAVLFSCGSPAVAGDCRVNPFRFFPAQNDSVATTAVLTGKACIHQFRAGDRVHFTSASIASRPANGTLEEGSLRFRYTPKPGFKGTGRYSVKVCGTAPSGSGCSTITYTVAVN